MDGSRSVQPRRQAHERAKIRWRHAAADAVAMQFEAAELLHQVCTREIRHAQFESGALRCGCDALIEGRERTNGVSEALDWSL